MRLIDADELKRKYAGFYNVYGKEKSIQCVEVKEIDWTPTVKAVPLEPLAKWIAENLSPRCSCSYCSKDRVCCDCPAMTEQQVKEELEKWMEEQDAVD